MVDETEADGAVAEIEQGNPQAENENAGQPGLGVEETSNSRVTSADKLNMLQSIEVQLAVEVGRAKMTIKDLLLLNEGSVIELDRMAGDPLEIIVNGASIAKGEIVMVGDKFGIRFVDISEPEKIAQSL
jgi:flagellar motor switch protein FliN/FliY